MTAMRALRIALLLNNPYTSDSRSWKLANSLTAARAQPQSSSPPAKTTSE